MTKADPMVTGTGRDNRQNTGQMKASAQRPQGKKARSWREYELGALAPFIAIHLGGLYGVLFMEVPTSVWIVCGVLYAVRMFAVTGWYHRYFSHRTFKTSRWLQAVMAFVAQTTSQRGALWWAAHHRDHHRYSDTDRDVHSPVRFGFWHAHVGWLYDQNSPTDYSKVKDFTKYPELVVLNELWLLPPIILGAVVWLFWGWVGLFVGFMFSTMLTWHATFCINSLAHVWGSRRYPTADRSRNNWLLALVTFGEGWHNNHHFFMNSTRQGFYWWEIDISYYILRAMAAVGLVWDLKEPSPRVYAPSSRISGQSGAADLEPRPPL